MTMTSSKDLPPHPGSYFSLVLHSQKSVKIPEPPRSTNLSGRTAIITGGNSGLGLECGRQLLALGLSRLIVGSRSVERGEAAVARLRTSHPKAALEVWELEMTSYDSIAAFAERCRGLDRIDLVVQSAGIAPHTFQLVPSTGHNDAIQVNFLGTVLLTMLLLPVLRDKRASSPGGSPPPSSAPRITVVCSTTAYNATLPSPSPASNTLIGAFDDPKQKVSLGPAGALYRTTKLFEILFLARLAEHVDPADVVLNMVDPGLTSGTGLTRGAGLGFRILEQVVGPLMGRSLEVGARTYVDAAVVQGPESHGSMVLDARIFPFPSVYYTAEGKKATDRLWREAMDEFRSTGAEDVVKNLRG